jgi:hypothetical protein
MREQEAADLDAGRIRLADLDSDDDYGGKRGRKKKGKKRGKKNRQSYVDEDSDELELHEPETWVNGVPMNEANGEAAGLDATTNAGNDKEQNHDIQQTETEQIAMHNANEDDVSQSSSKVSSEPDSWRCECCRKDFKSEKQFDNHVKSKKHKDTLKKLKRN